MRKYRRLIIFVTSFLAILFAWFSIYKLNISSYVEYQIDEANSCGWRYGKVAGSTLVLGPQHTVKLKRSEEKAFLQKAAATSLCATKI